MPESGGIGSFLKGDTAGIPNWGWIAIIVVGIGAAYVVPKFFNKGASSSGTPTTGTDQGASGIGLAIDPTTGLPYAVEGLVPSGGTTGTQGVAGPQGPAGPAGAPGPQGPAGPAGQPGKEEPTKPPPVKPPVSTARYVTVQKWPNILGSLSGIASKYGISLARIEQLNPQIKNPNLIYPGQQVRVA